MNDICLQRTNVIGDMSDQYSSSKICPYNNQDCKDDEKLSLEPGMFDLKRFDSRPATFN